MEKLSKELIGASSIPIILTIISANETYGYDIIQRVKAASDNKMVWKDGTLYPVLHKLEKGGYIESYWKVGDSGRKRKYYRINEDGKKELDAKKENWIFMNNLLEKLWKVEPNLI